MYSTLHSLLSFIDLLTASDGVPQVAQSCTQMNGAEQTMYPTMTTTVSLIVFILALQSNTPFGYQLKRIFCLKYLEMPLTECVLGLMLGPAAAALATVVVAAVGGAESLFPDPPSDEDDEEGDEGFITCGGDLRVEQEFCNNRRLNASRWKDHGEKWPQKIIYQQKWRRYSRLTSLIDVAKK